MDPQKILQEIEDAEHMIRSLRLFPLFLTYCRGCRRHEKFLSIGVRTAEAVSNGGLQDNLFELVDGLCLNPDCPTPDTLWPILCKQDSQRERYEGARPERRRNQMCDVCMGMTFFGIWRAGNCTIGECLDPECRSFVVPASFYGRAVRSVTAVQLTKQMLEDRLTALRACLDVARATQKAASHGR